VVTRKTNGASASTPAYVLHAYNWSESSLILDLFTRAHGRVVAVAKGAKRPHSQLRPVLMPFQRIDVAFGRRSEADDQVWLLRQAEWGGGVAWPGGAALLPGLYANELLMRLLPRHDPMPRLWLAYAALLPLLTSEDAMQAALRAFELLLLRQMGHLPDLSLHSASGDMVEDDVLYTLYADLGVAEAQQQDAALPGWLMRQLEQALSHAAEQTLSVKQVSSAIPSPLLQACQLASSPLKSLTRALLLYHVGPAPLRTRQLMQDLAQWQS